MPGCRPGFGGSLDSLRFQQQQQQQQLWPSHAAADRPFPAAHRPQAQQPSRMAAAPVFAPAAPAPQQQGAGADPLPYMGLSVSVGRPSGDSLDAQEQQGRGLRAELAERLAASLPPVSPRYNCHALIVHDVDPL
jgi:hypothetical protein